jgi:O-antigen ligase
MSNKLTSMRALASRQNNLAIFAGIFSIFIAAFFLVTARAGNVPLIIGLALPALLLITVKAPYIFPLGVYVFFLPFDSLLIASGTAEHAATFTKYLGILSIGALLFKGVTEHRLKKPDSAVLWWVFYIAFALFSAMWAMNLNTALYSARVVTALGLLMLYVAVSMYPLEAKEYEALKKFIMYGGLVAAAITAYNYGNSLTYMQSGRATLESDGKAMDPNQLAFSLLIPLGIALQQMLNAKKPLKALFYSAVFGILAYAILITDSRGAALGAIIISAILLYSSPRRARALLTVLVLAAITIFLAPENYYKRFTTDAYQRGGAGRLDIWRVGMDAFSHNWLVGVGLDNFPFAYDKYGYGVHQMQSEGFARVAHNIFLTCGVELGIVGLLIMAFVIVKHYMLISHSGGSDRVLLKACFIGCLIQAFTLDVIWRKTFWLLWMLIVMYNLTQSERKNELDSSVTHVSL